MRFEYGALPWEMLGRRPVMITLTYPGKDWELWVEDARELDRHREAFRSRWTRRFGSPIGVWVTEFQKRGAPHLHMYMALPDAVSEGEYIGLQKRTMERRRLERDMGRYAARGQMRAPKGEFSMWLRTAWWEIVGSGSRNHHGRGVDIATAFFSDRAEAEANRIRVADYFWRESGKWQQKRPPEGFGGLRFYGRWGGNQGFKPIVTEAQVDERTGLELRRVLLRWQQQKRREEARRGGWDYRKRGGGSRGRDGLTVFDVNGRSGSLDFSAGRTTWPARRQQGRSCGATSTALATATSGPGRSSSTSRTRIFRQTSRPMTGRMIHGPSRRPSGLVRRPKSSECSKLPPPRKPRSKLRSCGPRTAVRENRGRPQPEQGTCDEAGRRATANGRSVPLLAGG